jgi:hypothetical protein
MGQISSNWVEFRKVHHLLIIILTDLDEELVLLGMLMNDGDVGEWVTLRLIKSDDCGFTLNG